MRVPVPDSEPLASCVADPPLGWISDAGFGTHPFLRWEPTVGVDEQRRNQGGGRAAGAAALEMEPSR
jgi:hypothetical protein